MRDLRLRGRPRLAVTLVLGFAVADGVGIYFAHQKLTQPWASAPGAGAYPQVAEAVSPPVLRDNEPQAPIAVAHYDFPPPVALASAFKSSPVPEFKPVVIDLEQNDTAGHLAERETVIPAVRIAAHRPARHQPGLFSSAFASDISRDNARSVPAGADVPQLAPAGAEDAAGSELPLVVQYGAATADLPAVSPEAPAVEAPLEPSATLAAESATATTSETGGQQPATQPIPELPEPEAGSAGELPAL